MVWNMYNIGKIIELMNSIYTYLILPLCVVMVLYVIIIGIAEFIESTQNQTNKEISNER